MGRLPTLNEYTKASRGKSWYKSANMKQETENKIIYAIRSQLPRKIKPPIYAVFNWYARDKRTDKDNIAFAKKFVFDALQKAGRLRNDGWDDISGFKDNFYIDSRKPRVEVQIYEEGERWEKIIQAVL